MYKPIPVNEMPCLKDKLTTVDIAVDEHVGRRKAHPDGMEIKCSLFHNSDYFIQILNNYCQSPLMMNVYSIKVNLKECCKNKTQQLFNDDIDLVITFLQHSQNWLKQRKYRVTGSRCYELFTYSNNDWERKSSSYFYPKEISNKYVRHGLKWENSAREKFIALTGMEVFECGMVISNSNQWLGFSADGIIFGDGQPLYLLEIKCLFKGATETIMESVISAKFIEKENGQFKLKKRHKYYGQIQMGMALLNLSRAYVALYASFDNSMLIIEVDFDYGFALRMLSKVKVQTGHISAISEARPPYALLRKVIIPPGDTPVMNFTFAQRFREEGINTLIAEDDADLLIVQTAIEKCQQYETFFIVGRDVDLLVLIIAFSPQYKDIRLLRESQATIKERIYSSRESSAVLRNCNEIVLFAHLSITYLWRGINLDPTQSGWKKTDTVLSPIFTPEVPAPYSVLQLISCNCRMGCGKRC
ncbi:hypothetical protein NQ318_007779, partial [Aromia moschata]